MGITNVNNKKKIVCVLTSPVIQRSYLERTSDRRFFCLRGRRILSFIDCQCHESSVVTKQSYSTDIQNNSIKVLKLQMISTLNQVYPKDISIIRLNS